MDGNEVEIEFLTRQIALKSFPEFVKFVHEREYGKKFIWNWHFQEVTNALISLMENDDQELLMINIPPRHGKTTIVTICFPVWWMLHHPSTEIIATGYSSTLTQEFSAQARDLYRSHSLDLLAPNRSMVRDDQNTKEYWKLNSGGRYYATGALGTITGKGADLALIDDPLNPNDAAIATGTNLRKVNEWFSNVLRSRMNSKYVNGVLKRGKTVIIMQRLHDNDLCGYLMDSFPEFFLSGAWKKVSIAAIAENDDAYRNKGEALFPALYPLKVLQGLKKTMINDRGANFFAAQYQQNPLDVETAEFKKSYFEYYSELNITERHLESVIAIDPAISQKTLADDTAVVVASKDVENRYYARSVQNEHYTPDQMMDVVFKTQSAYGCPVVIETIGFQRVLAGNLKKEMKIRGQFFELLEINSRGEKEARIRSTLQPLYSNHRVFHNESLKGSDLEDQLLRFPVGKHDDCIDAFETAISVLRGKTGGAEIKSGIDYDEVLGDQRRKLDKLQGRV